MKHSRNSQQIQGDFQDFEAPAPAEPEYAGEVTMALPPVPMPDPNARRGLAQPAAKRSVLWSVLGILGAVLNRVDMAGSGYYHRYYGKYSKYTKYYENEPAK